MSGGSVPTVVPLGQYPLPGVDFDFGGGRWYLVPPANFGTLERMREKINALPQLEAGDPAAQGSITDLAFEALRRNYPTITRDMVLDLVDVGNMFDVQATVLDVGGMKRRQQQAEREATAGKEQATGLSSGAASSPE